MIKHILLALILLVPAGLRAESINNAEPSTIRVAPPAPVFTDAERQAELARRRAAVLQKMTPNSVMILWSAEPRNYAGDVSFMYRQENNLYYLTSLRQSGATLVLAKKADGATQETLFLPRRDPAMETWNGKMYSREQATRISGLQSLVDSSELNVFLQALRDKKTFTSKDGATVATGFETVYLLIPEEKGDPDGRAEFRRESEFAKSLSGYKIINARSEREGVDIFGELRLVKSPMEIKLLQHAIDITTEAQGRSMAMVNRAKWEYEVQAEVEYTFRRRNADYWGYPSIVGCGPNATTLHYVESQGAIKNTDLLLMDVGAEYDHYTADVTRTFPVSGKFTKEQAEIYQIVFDAQEAAARTIKPGANFQQPSNAAANVIKQGLARLGLITAPDATIQFTFNGQTYNRPQYTLFYMHGWGHWLGMNVHDVGSYGAAFKPGMIMTNEPGIYIREDALDYLAKTPENEAVIAKLRPVFERYKNIGVRIEDDMLVTATGVEWMTKALPRTLQDVEAFMAKASKEMQYSRRDAKVQPELAILNRESNVFLENNLQSIFGSTEFPTGQTVRRGWISVGRETAFAGLSHAGH